MLENADYTCNYAVIRQTRQPTHLPVICIIPSLPTRRIIKKKGSGKHFHNVLCLSEAKGMDIKMSEDKIIKIIDELYEKYGVERIFYSDMGTEQIIRGMKGILANLDLNKQKSYTKEDAELIKDIYFMYC